MPAAEVDAAPSPQETEPASAVQAPPSGYAPEQTVSVEGSDPPGFEAASSPPLEEAPPAHVLAEDPPDGTAFELAPVPADWGVLAQDQSAPEGMVLPSPSDEGDSATEQLLRWPSAPVDELGSDAAAVPYTGSDTVPDADSDTSSLEASAGTLSQAEAVTTFGSESAPLDVAPPVVDIAAD